MRVGSKAGHGRHCHLFIKLQHCDLSVEHKHREEFWCYTTAQCVRNNPKPWTPASLERFTEMKGQEFDDIQEI